MCVSVCIGLRPVLAPSAHMGDMHMYVMLLHEPPVFAMTGRPACYAGEPAAVGYCAIRLCSKPLLCGACFCQLASPGRTAQLVAKYRPPMPIVTLVVPRLINDGIKWRLEGR